MKYDQEVYEALAENERNKPVAWIDPHDLERLPLNDCWVNGEKSKWADVPLYTHPHPDNLGLAESIIKQQQLEIEALKDEVAEWKMSYENCHRMCSGYGMN
jgi:hypothetical protein